MIKRGTTSPVLWDAKLVVPFCMPLMYARIDNGGGETGGIKVH